MHITQKKNKYKTQMKNNKRGKVDEDSDSYHSQLTNEEKEKAKKLSQEVMHPADIGTKDKKLTLNLSLFDFPTTTKYFANGAKKQKCSLRVLETFSSWIEYSVSLDRVYCFVCRWFVEGEQASAFVKGYNNWNDLKNQAQYHEKYNPQHQTAMDNYRQYQLMKNTNKEEIRHVYLRNGAKEVRDNRQYVRALVTTLLLTAKQNIAQRSHRVEVL